MMRRLAIVSTVAVVALLLAGCSGSTATSQRPPSSGTAGTSEPPDGPISSLPPTTANTTTTTSVPLPKPSLYTPGAGEPEPQVKAAAARFLEIVTTYDPGGGTPEATAARLVGAGLRPDPSSEVVALLDGGAEAVGEIVYPQLGGLTGSQASVMTVIRQTFRSSEGQISTVTRSVDVRLDKVNDAWTVTSVASDGGGPPSSPSSPALTPLARQVLGSPRLSMSDSSRWDVAAGRIDDRVLQLVSTLTETNALSITVFATGHPANVFGATSVSNHTEGRGVDVWAVDGQPIVDASPESTAHAVIVAALELGATEVGSPWDLDGPGGPSFANALHADHLHLAFDA